MPEFWLRSGHRLLEVDGHGGLVATDAFIADSLQRPEFAAAAGAGDDGSRRIADRLAADPRAVIDGAMLAAAGAGARDAWQQYLHWRDRLVAGPNLQSAYARMYADAAAAGRLDVPMQAAERLSQVIVQQMLAGCDDGLTLRVAELWYREQMVIAEDGRLLLADRQTLETRGARSIDRLDAHNAREYFGRDDRHDFSIDLAPDGAAALVFADLVARWIRRMIDVAVHVHPVATIDDSGWRWHVGLDAQASQLLERLFRGDDPSPQVTKRRVLLPLRLEFDQASDVLAEIAGTAVWLALAADERGGMRMKPQNLLFNLPLAARQ